ncbi:MAG TPA: tetratricopeptide repeat protein [Steroidobacteraceae bacterium]|nr:tetratricopeptide repeat protein [Steroidobacteraceae bacterium]
MVRDSRKIAAILAADVVDYSRLMGADEAGTLAALAARRSIFDAQVREFDGRVFGSVGDSLMAEFHSAVHAVECAQAIQQAVATENASLPGASQMRLRIGVNLGDVIEDKDGVAGDAVNVAARLQALAKPGGVLISGAVHEQVHLKIPARYADAGTRRVKNIEEPIHVFEVLPPPKGVVGRARAAVAHAASRRSMHIVGTAAAFIAVAATGLFWRDIPVPGTNRNLGNVFSPAAANLIAVLPFRNLTGDAGNDYLGDGLAEELAHRLGKIPGLKVSARSLTFAYRGRDVDARQVADALGASYVVEGSVRRQGDRVRVNAALVERDSGANRWSNSYETSGDLFAVEDDIGREVLTALELVLDVKAGTGPTPARPSDPGSYDVYLRGLSNLRKPRSARTLDEAERLFTLALTSQPGFARAQAGLCQARVDRYLLERIPGHVTSAEEACARARALDSTAHEVFEAMGSLRLVTGKSAEAEAAYRRALAIAPDHPDALIGLADALAAGSKSDEAEQTLRRAIAVQPRYAAAHDAYGSFLYTHGRPAEAIVPYERVTILQPDNPNAFNNLGAAYLNLGDFDRAATAFSQSLSLEPRRASYSNTGIVEYHRGRYREAAELFAKAAELAPSDHRLWGNLADALLFDGRPAEAREAYATAMQRVEGELSINPKHAVNQAQAAYYATRLGDGDRARQCMDAALAEGDKINEVHYYVALAELGLGNQADAVSHVKRARELGYPEVFLRSAPELEAVRKNI